MPPIYDDYNDESGFGEVIVGERSNFKKIPTHTQDHGNDMYDI